MSLARNILGVFMPHPESRRTSGTLAALSAEVVHTLDGDNNAIIHLNGTGTFSATYEIHGSPDGTNYYPLTAYPYSPGSVGGTLPLPSQPLLTEVVNAATVARILCVPTGGLRLLRIRLAAYSSGTGAVNITSDMNASINPYICEQKAAALVVTTTAAVGVAATASLPAVVGLRHYIDKIAITRSATAALTASATPVVITTTNLPGALAFTLGSDAGGIGVDREISYDPGSSGLAALLAGTISTVVCPAYVGVIWRVTVTYRLGL